MSTAEIQRVEWRGRTGPFTLELTGDVFAPTHVSRVLAETLDIRAEDTVIDVGSGSGVLSFVAARLGALRVFGCDISEQAVRVARDNARRLGLADRTEFRSGDLFDPVRGISADVVIGDVAGIPDEIAAVSGWYPGGHAGGPTGAEVPVAMLESMGDCLKPGGRLYLPTATIQDEERVIEAARRVFGAGNLEEVAEREFPLPALVAGSRALARMMAEGWLRLRQKGSRLLWRMQVWRCQRG
jgi:release factor glutamine methyltransferase